MRIELSKYKSLDEARELALSKAATSVSKGHAGVEGIRQEEEFSHLMKMMERRSLLRDSAPAPKNYPTVSASAKAKGKAFALEAQAVAAEEEVRMQKHEAIEVAHALAVDAISAAGSTREVEAALRNLELALDIQAAP